MRIIGHHRSLALAERHLRALGEGWHIESRRNTRGEYSERGHTFTFVKELEKTYEWLVTFTYEGTGRSIDVIVTAKNEGEAEETALAFLARDPNGEKIVDHIQYWTIRTARGRESAPHKPEYRRESKK